MAATGLLEGKSNDHPGQGTANRRFFCANTTLELLYVRDEREAAAGKAAGLHFVERTHNPDASPFGLIVYRSADNENDPFPGWSYCPDYFPANQCFHVGDNTAVAGEPLCICMPAGFPPPTAPEPPANLSFELTELIIDVPVREISRPLETVARCDGVTLQLDKPHRMELVFNHGSSGTLHDLTTQLPLVLRW